MKSDQVAKLLKLLDQHTSDLTEAQKLDVLQAVEHLATPAVRIAAARISADLFLSGVFESERRELAQAAWVERAGKVRVSLTLAGDLVRRGVEDRETYAWEEVVAHV